MSSSLILAAAATALAPAADVQPHAFRLDHVLGASFDMAVSAPSAAQAEFAFAAALTEIRRLDGLLSGWRADSELQRLNAAETHAASPELFEVIAACERWRAKTDGAFSGRLGAVEAALERGDTTAACRAARTAEAAEVALVRAERTVRKPADLAFAPDGLAKGYIIDRALAAARRAAPCADAILIDIGGDMACWGERTWNVGVADPARLAENAEPYARLRLANRALAVSGPGMRDRPIDGVAQSHLLSPATGEPAPRRQAAVIAPDAMTADALATALAVLPPARGLALAAAHAGVEALVLEAGRAHATPGWTACQAGAPLPSGFEVEVSYELPKLDVPNYKKPFVIVWVTDAEKNPIKTLLIQGKKPDWQEDNYVWYRRYGRKTPGVVEAVGKPTRPPGRYTVGWDGTDEAGKRVAQGAYIIHVEAAREKGGHAYQTIEVNLGAGPVSGSAAAKDELGASSARYGKGK